MLFVITRSWPELRHNTRIGRVVELDRTARVMRPELVSSGHLNSEYFEDHLTDGPYIDRQHATDVAQEKVQRY